MSDRDTAALRDSVIEQMADERDKHRLYRSSPSGEWYCDCNEWRLDDVATNVARPAFARHVEERVLARALAVTACTTCGGTGWVDRQYRPGVIDPCPVCHGTPPRALRWTSEYEQVGCGRSGGRPSSYYTGYIFDDVLLVPGPTKWVPVFVLTERNKQDPI